MRKTEKNLKRRLRYHLKKLGFLTQHDGRLAPPEATKATVRQMHQYQRFEKIKIEKKFVDTNWPKLKKRKRRRTSERNAGIRTHSIRYMAVRAVSPSVVELECASIIRIWKAVAVSGVGSQQR